MFGGRLLPGPALRILGGLVVLVSLAFPVINHGADVSITGGSSSSLMLAAAFMLAGGIGAVVAPGGRVSRFGLITAFGAAYIVFKAYSNAKDIVDQLSAQGASASIGARIWVAAAGIVLGVAGFALDRRSPRVAPATIADPAVEPTQE